MPPSRGRAAADPNGAAGAAEAGFGAVTVVAGAEELLADRAVAAVVAAARAEQPGVDVVEAAADTLTAGGFAELVSPSLFSPVRLAVLRGAELLAADVAAELLRYAAAPSPDAALVVIFAGGAKGRGVLTKLRGAGARVVPCEPLKAYELPGFVVAEVRRAGGRIDDEAAGRLVDGVGTDLRALAAAAAQLVGDVAALQAAAGAPGAGGNTGRRAAVRIDAAAVRRYYAGRAEVSGFAVADAAIQGETGRALEQLRWALHTGVAPVLLTSAMAAGLRGLARLAGAPRGLAEAELAREVGVPPWKLKSLRRQLAGWRPAGLAAAIQAVARADADVKGAAADAGYACERMVLTVAAARAGS